MTHLRLIVVASLFATPFVSAAPETSAPSAQVNPSALSQFLAAQPPSAGTTFAIAWLAGFNPLDTLCAEIIESPWVLGVSQAVHPVPGETGYFIDLPLAAWGALTSDGSGVNAAREDNAFRQADVTDYLRALGIHYTAHDGIGTTSYAHIMASTSSPPLLC